MSKNSGKLLKKQRQNALSLLELLAVITILSIIITLAVSTFFSSKDKTERNSCYVNKGEIAVQAQLWYRNKGSWPASDLSDIAADPAYYPAGLPTCPVDGTSYTIDPNSHEVISHTH